MAPRGAAVGGVMLLSPPRISHSWCPRRRAEPGRQQNHQNCHYYRGHSSSSSRPHAPSWPTSPDPSPYEILGHRSTGPYSKARFCRLVKMYHPDTAQHSVDSSIVRLSPSQILERYRLIVAAHALLSDPQKRQAYDRHGAGWRRPTQMPAARPRHNYYESTRSNATWEDWEQWRRRQEEHEQGDQSRSYYTHGAYGQHGRQKAVFMSNGAFICILTAASVLNGCVQAVRARALITKDVRWRDEHHRRTEATLLESRGESLAMTQEERLARFVAHRAASEPWSMHPIKVEHSKEATDCQHVSSSKSNGDMDVIEDEDDNTVYIDLNLLSA